MRPFTVVRSPVLADIIKLTEQAHLFQTSTTHYTVESITLQYKLKILLVSKRFTQIQCNNVVCTERKQAATSLFPF